MGCSGSKAGPQTDPAFPNERMAGAVNLQHAALGFKGTHNLMDHSVESARENRIRERREWLKDMMPTSENSHLQEQPQQASGCPTSSAARQLRVDAGPPREGGVALESIALHRLESGGENSRKTLWSSSTSSLQEWLRDVLPSSRKTTRSAIERGEASSVGQQSEAMVTGQP